MQVKPKALRMHFYDSLSSNTIFSLRLSKDNKSHNLHEVNEQALSKKLFANRQDPLPQITSPYLKKTVNNLFPYNSCQVSPVQLEKSNHFQKYSKSILEERISIGARAHKIFNSAEFVNETNQQGRRQTRIPKSFSQVKSDPKITQSSPTVKSTKLITQQSNSSNTSSKIYQKTINLNSLQGLRLVKEPEKTAEKNIPQFRQSSFVLKQKLAHSLYSQEKSELKLVQSILASKQLSSMGKSIKVKKYTKFAPNIINIES